MLPANSTSSNQKSSTIDTKELADIKKITLEQFSDKVIHYMKQIVDDNEMRMKDYKNGITKLTQGVFYGNEYYRILKELSKKLRDKNDELTKEESASLTSLESRLNWLIGKGSFYHGFAARKFFDNVESPRSPSGMVSNNFIINKGEQPSTALKALMIGLTLTGCGEAIQVAEYAALLDVLGEEKFNAIFSAEGQTPLKIGKNQMMGFHIAPIEHFLKFNGPAETIKKGQLVFFSNIQNYGIKHINGEAAGFNTLCIEDGPNAKFLGLGLSKDGVTETEVNDTLLSEYNSAPIGYDLFPKSVAQRIKASAKGIEKQTEALKNDRMEREEFLKKLTQPMSFSFRIDRVNDVMKATNEKAIELLGEWSKSNSMF